MEIGLLVLRATVGALFAAHGAQKLFGWFGRHGLAGTAGFFESIGLRPGRLLALGAGAAEFVGGLLFVLGFVPPVAAALLSAVMFCAIWMVHRTNGLWATNGGVEYNLVLLAVVFAVTAVGAGAWSLDNVLGVEAYGAGWALGSLAAGLVGAIIAVAAAKGKVGHRAGRATPAGA
jgi:putative oxidoreductase